MAVLDTSYRSIIKLAMPIILGAFVQSILLFTDSYFLSEYSRISFTAVGNAGLLFITLYMVGSGLADAGQIVIANQSGQGKEEGVRKAFQTNAVNLVYLAGMMFILIHVFRIYIMPEFIHSENIGKEMDSFLSYRAFGYFFSFGTLAITAYYLGIGRSMIMLYNTLLLCGINIVLDYGFIFGNWGLPEMGTEGAALASVISEAIVLLFSMTYLYYDKWGPPLRDFKWVRDLDFKKRLFKIALPLMAQGFVAVGAWTAYFMMIEQMGEHDNEVSQIIHKLYFLALTPMFGFGAATKTYVSNLLATSRVDDAKKAIKRIMIINYLFVIAFVHGNILYPDFWIRVVYNPSVLDPQVLADVKAILVIITGSILIHAAAMVFQNVIAGSGATMTALKFELISIIVYLILCYLMIFEIQANIREVWLMEYVYFTIFLVLTFAYYRSGKWKKSVV